MNCNSPYAKSCIRVDNPVDQPFTAAVAPLTLEGTPIVNSGCSLVLNRASIQVVKSGLYHFSADVIITPTAAGLVTFQLYKDGAALPCAIAQETVATGDAYSMHIETDLCINTCCVSNPFITVTIGGVTGTVNNLCVGALKLA